MIGKKEIGVGKTRIEGEGGEKEVVVVVMDKKGKRVGVLNVKYQTHREQLVERGTREVEIVSI